MIERNRADRSVSILIRDDHRRVSIFLGGFHFLERIPTFLREKVFLIDKANAILGRKFFRALPAQHHVRRSLHHEPRQLDRVFDVAQNSDCSGFKRLTVHDRGVQLICARAREHGALAGVEMWVVFERAHGRLRRIEARAVSIQNVVAGPQRLFQTGAIFSLLIRSHFVALDRPSAAVNDQSEFFLVHRIGWIVDLALLLRIS